MTSGQQPPQADSRKKLMTERRNGFNIRGDLLTLLVLILVNLGASIWWASGITKDVSHLEENDARAAMEYRLLRETQVAVLQEIAALTQAMVDRGLVDGAGQ